MLIVTYMSVELRAQADLRWQEWDDEFVVYNPVSGDTHFLDYLSAQGLKRLQKRAMSMEQLVDDLADSLTIGAHDALGDYVSRLVSELVELGLVYPVDP